MSTVYVETSAVVAWLLEEEAVRAASVIDASKKTGTSVLTILEAERALLRAQREGRISVAQVLKLQGLLAQASASWNLMEMTPDVRSRAAKPFPVEPVRTLDAIHLATSLEFAKVFPDLSVLSFDDRILKNLEPLGLDRAAAGA